MFSSLTQGRRAVGAQGPRGDDLPTGFELLVHDALDARYVGLVDDRAHLGSEYALRFGFVEQRSKLGHRLHQVDAAHLRRKALVHFQERHNALHIPQIVRARLPLDLPVHGVLEQDSAKNPLAGEARAGNKARAHPMHDTKHLSLVGPRIFLDSVRLQRFPEPAEGALPIVVSSLHPAPPFARFGDARVWFQSSPIWRRQATHDSFVRLKFARWHVQRVQRCIVREELSGLTFCQTPDDTDPFAVRALFVDPNENVDWDLPSILAIGYAARLAALHGDLVAGCRGIRDAFRLCYTWTGRPDDPFYAPDMCEAEPIL
jgi:hypothetical protein